MFWIPRAVAQEFGDQLLLNAQNEHRARERQHVRRHRRELVEAFGGDALELLALESQSGEAALQLVPDQRDELLG